MLRNITLSRPRSPTDCLQEISFEMEQDEEENSFCKQFMTRH